MSQWYPRARPSRPLLATAAAGATEVTEAARLELRTGRAWRREPVYVPGELTGQQASGRGESAVNVLETDRLILRWLSADDAEFVLGLVNEPSWLQFIGDRGVRSLNDARAYIQNGPAAMYNRFGFGLYLVQRKEDGARLGMCGLIKREGLADVDIGFAFFPRFWSKGYAYEAAAAVMDHGRALGLRRIVAITSPDNQSSIKLLQKLGMKFERNMTLPGPSSEVMLFGSTFDQPGGA